MSAVSRSDQLLNGFFRSPKMNAKKKTSIPFEFVLEQLYSANVEIRPMFGCFALYVRNKVVLILRDRKVSKVDNGVWIATSREHHTSLQSEFPSMRSIKVFGTNESNWQNLPSDANDFEEMVIRACELILRGDQRIGRVTKAKSAQRNLKKRTG